MTHAMPPAGRLTLHGVQCLRAIAALAVVTHHLLSVLNHQGFALGWFQGAEYGRWGVDLFFVISGFIMVVTTRDVQPSWRASWHFLLRRFFRVSPLYYLMTTLGLLVALSRLADWRQLDVAHVLASYAYWPHWPQAHTGRLPLPLWGIGWTLNFEMYFYAVFACLLLTRHVLPLALAWFTASVLAGFVWQLDAVWWWQVTNPLLLSFAMGMLAGRCWLSGRVPAAMGPLMGWVGLLAIVSLDVCVPDKLDVHRVLFGALSTVVVLSMAERLSVGERALAPPALWLNRLGDASYALYLVHPLILSGMGKLLSRPAWQTGPGTALAALGLTAACVASAWLLHAWCERPLQRLTATWLR